MTPYADEATRIYARYVKWPAILETLTGCSWHVVRELPRSETAAKRIRSMAVFLRKHYAGYEFITETKGGSVRMYCRRLPTA